jgi:hypothetical protein
MSLKALRTISSSFTLGEAWQRPLRLAIVRRPVGNRQTASRRSSDGQLAIVKCNGCGSPTVTVGKRLYNGKCLKNKHACATAIYSVVRCNDTLGVFGVRHHCAAQHACATTIYSVVRCNGTLEVFGVRHRCAAEKQARLRHRYI